MFFNSELHYKSLKIIGFVNNKHDFIQGESYFKNLLTQDLGFEILKVFLCFCYCFIVFRHNCAHFS